MNCIHYVLSNLPSNLETKNIFNFFKKLRTPIKSFYQLFSTHRLQDKFYYFQLN